MSTATEALAKKLLTAITDKPEAEIKNHDRLVEDLRVDGDDFSMTFVPRVNREFGIKVPWREWESVRTVADVVAIIELHRSSQPRMDS